MKAPNSGLMQATTKINWKLLRSQKAWLVHAATPEADGLTMLLDALQDAVVEDGIATESEVFGAL